MCQNIIPAVLVGVDPFFPDLYLYKCIEFSVYGTISFSLVCQNMIRLLVYYSGPAFIPTYACTSVWSLGYTVHYLVCVVVLLFISH